MEKRHLTGEKNREEECKKPTPNNSLAQTTNSPQLTPEAGNHKINPAKQEETVAIKHKCPVQALSQSSARSLLQMGAMLGAAGVTGSSQAAFPICSPARASGEGFSSVLAKSKIKGITTKMCLSKSQPGEEREWG